MRRNGYLGASGRKSDLAILFSDSSVGIQIRYVLAISLVRNRRNGSNSASGQKSDPPFAPATSISYSTGEFPLPSDVYGLPVSSMICATTSHDLVTLTFDILTLRVFHVQCFSCPTHIPIFIN